MNKELDVLLSVYYDTINNITHLQHVRSRLDNIKHKISSMDNNYFDVKCNSDLFTNYIEIFDDNDEYTKLIDDLESLKSYLEEKIQSICVHDWVEDLIDIDPDRSQYICYCSKCEITKK